MKKIPKLISVAIAILLAACSKVDQVPKNNDITIHGSGNLASKEINISEFDCVEVGLWFDLRIRSGEAFNVTLTADDNFIDFILVEKVGSTLIFALQPGYAYNIFDVTMQAEVTLPDLAGLTLDESSHAMLIDAKSTDNFAAELTGSSVLEGKLQVATASFNLSGSTYLNLAGSAEHLMIDSCGSSVADLERFAVEDAVLEVSCNSKTAVTVAGKLDIDASQHSQVFYSGEPVLVNSSIFENAFVGQE